MFDFDQHFSFKEFLLLEGYPQNGDATGMDGLTKDSQYI